jgi:hypothetical protein
VDLKEEEEEEEEASSNSPTQKYAPYKHLNICTSFSLCAGKMSMFS